VSKGFVGWASKLRLGKEVKAGERTLPVIGKRVAEDTLIRSRRVLTNEERLGAGVAPLFKGMGGKAGVGAAVGAGKEAANDAHDGRFLNQGHTVGETRENLDV
jgi:hypothetical protein